MSIYHLFAINPKEKPWTYCSNYSHVIRANSKEEARALAASVAQSEGAEVWLDEGKTLCKYIDPTVSSSGPNIVLTDYYEG